MGIIQNDTNNIIVDAVITDAGRQAIARNDGSFSVVKWAASDEEVDYSIIQQFGKTNGEAKIVVNTPVFEALTSQQFSQKYKLMSISNPALIRLPTLKITGEGVDASTNAISIGNTTVKRRTVTVFQDILNETTIDLELRDQSFMITLPSRFLQIRSIPPDDIDATYNALYFLTRDSGETTLGGSRLSFTVETKSISETDFQIYGTRTNKNIIKCYMKIAGIQSGAVLDIEVSITKTS
jgi:hypothetical protein